MKKGIEEKLAEYCGRVTGEWREAASPKGSESSKRIGEIVSKFGCYTEAVVELVKELTGRTATLRTEPYPRPLPGVVLVPLVCTNSHSYPIGLPCMVLSTGWDYCLRENGTTGNTLGHIRGEVRAATEEETEEFVKKCISTIAEYLIVVEL